MAEHSALIGEHQTWLNLIPGVNELEHSMHAKLGNGLLFGTEIHAYPQVWTGLLVMLLLIIIGVRYRGALASAGDGGVVPARRFGLRAVVETICDYALDTMATVMGRKAAKAFFPFIATFAFFILFSNLLGLIPGFLPPTDSLNTTASCSILVFLATHVYGVKENGMAHFKHMAGPVLALAPLIFIIELIGHMARPLSLSLRLAGNMIGDHMALSNFLTLSEKAFYLPIPVAIIGLGLVVCLVQTLVFCLLSTVYIGMAIEHHDHAEAH